MFTKSFFHQYFGQFDFTPINIDERRSRKASFPLPPIPPHTMFGKPEDTIQNVKHLVPKRPRQDRIKLMENEHRLLRYEAMMVKPVIAHARMTR
jgi:EF-hand domain-containing protein 1